MKNSNPTKYFMLISLSFLIFTGCAATLGIENENVREAIYLQNQVLKDPMFVEILRELQNEGKIDWTGDRTKYVVRDAAKYKNNVEWLIAMYEERGGFESDSVFLWRKFWPWSNTTAETYTSAGQTKLNKWKLSRDKYSILNTLIHERVHSFGLIHYQDQTRVTNLCDAAYIAGDLAEALILRMHGIKERIMDQPICPALVEKINKYGLIKIIDTN